MNSTEIFAQPHLSQIPDFTARVIAVDPPLVPTAAQAAAGFSPQKILVMDLTTSTSMEVFIGRATLHVGSELVGKTMRFESTEGRGIKFCIAISATNAAAHAAAKKAGEDTAPFERRFIQLDHGVRIARALKEQPEVVPVVTPASNVPEPEPEVVTDGAVTPTPEPQAPPAEPEAPEPGPEPTEAPEAPPAPPVTSGGLVIGNTLMKFARGQVLCRIATITAFEEAGFELSAEHLAGAASSLFIEMNKKGLMDEAVELAFGPESVGKKRKSALPDPGPQEAPRLLGDKPKRGSQQPKPTPVVTNGVPGNAATPAEPAAAPPTPPPAAVASPPSGPTATPTPSAATSAATTTTTAAAPPEPAPSPAPAPVEKTEPAAPPARPGAAGPAGPDDVIAKFKEYYLSGKLTPELKVGLHQQVTKFGMEWKPLYEIVVGRLSAKYNPAAVEAVLGKMKTLLRNTSESDFHKSAVNACEMLESHVVEFVKKSQA